MATVIATLRDSRTGYTKGYQYEVEDEYADSQYFIWMDGNYSCDCNRSIFLYDWDESKELDCGDNVICLLSLRVNGREELDGLPTNYSN